MTDPKSISLLTAELDNDDGPLVTLSDGTTAGYVVEELLDLRPHREPTPPLATKVRRTSSDPYFPKDLPPAIA